MTAATGPRCAWPATARISTTAEQRVIERERWYRALVRNASDVVAVLDADLSVRFASPTCRDVLGVEPDSLAGRHRVELIHPDDLEQVAHALRAVRTDGTDRTVRYRFRRPDGTVRSVESRVSNRLDDAVIRGIVVNTRDVTEAEDANRARDASEAALRTVVRSAPAAIFAVDRGGAIQLWNPASEALFGWTAVEVVGRPVPFLSPQQTRAARARGADLLDGREVSGEARFRHRDGHPIIAAISAAPVRGADGDVAEIVVVAVDVTDRVRSDREVKRRAELDRFVASLCRDLVEAVPESLDGHVVAGLEHLAVHFGAQAAALHVRDLATARFRWPAETAIHVDLERVPAGGVFAFDDDHPRAGWVIAGASGALGHARVGLGRAAGDHRRRSRAARDPGRGADRSASTGSAPSGPCTRATSGSAPWPSTRRTSSWSSAATCSCGT